MGSTKKSSSAERRNGHQSPKTNKTKNPPVSTTKRSENKTPPSPGNMTPPSRVSFANTSNHTRPESEATTVSNPYQTHDGYAPEGRARQLEHDLLGIDRRLLEGYNLDEPGQAAFVDSAGFTQASECPHHGPILAMGGGAGTRERSLSPMTRWLMEGQTEQGALLLLQDENLSIHKECRCGRLLEAGIELDTED